MKIEPMKRVRLVVATLFATSLCMPIFGHAQHGDSLWWNQTSSYVVPIDEVAVEARRPMSKIGRQESLLDSLALHENTALSIADVLTYNSSIFVKHYGRATLSTVSFRGTSPSHTQVTWNGLKVQSPMLGQTDFSMIPSSLVDRATLLHGPSSVASSGGGLGGAVNLESAPADMEGLHLKFIQGVGSFTTFDEFLRLDYGTERLLTSTRFIYSTSRNDFKYTNYNKKEHIYDENHQIVSSYYPEERNKNGAFRDLHLMQELRYNLRADERLSLKAWYLNSKRGVPMLSVDYRDDKEFTNEQLEQTLRTILGWERLREDYRLKADAGYVYSSQHYDYARDTGGGHITHLNSTQSTIHTLHASLSGEFYPSRKWVIGGELLFDNHWVRSRDLLNGTGYDKHRPELSLYLSAKWAPIERLGVALSLREELIGGELSNPIPLFSMDYLLSKRGNVMLKGSVTRNYRFPTLNDLYFEPGGNPDLKPEQGFSYDLGASFSVSRASKYRVNGSVTWFDSKIDNWIVWLPTFNGFWTPENIKRVDAYGVELKADADIWLGKRWQLSAAGSFSWTPSINRGDEKSWSDESIGKQLVYIPLYSSSANFRVAYTSWRLGYKWCYYGERFTTSSNDKESSFGSIDPYSVSELSLEKLFSPKWAHLSLKLDVKNLFDAEYESVLSRPMPGIHFEFFIEIRPKW